MYTLRRVNTAPHMQPVPSYTSKDSRHCYVWSPITRYIVISCSENTPMREHLSLKLLSNHQGCRCLSKHPGVCNLQCI